MKNKKYLKKLTIAKFLTKANFLIAVNLLVVIGLIVFLLLPLFSSFKITDLYGGVWFRDMSPYLIILYVCINRIRFLVNRA